MNALEASYRRPKTRSEQIAEAEREVERLEGEREDAYAAESEAHREYVADRTGESWNGFRDARGHVESVLAELVAADRRLAELR